MFWAYPAPGFGRLADAYCPVLRIALLLAQSPRRARDHAGPWRHHEQLLRRGGVVLSLRFPQLLTRRCEPLAVPTFGVDQCIVPRSPTDPTCPAWHESAPCLLHLSWNPSYVYYTGFDTEREPIMPSIF